MSPTISMRATEAGIVLGTAQYMAPEQARGRPVDRRADIWAFGCVLFEMLAGRRVFEGNDVTDIIVAILSKEPDWERLPASAVAIRPLLSRCLRKDPKQRLQAIGDARIQIEELLAVAPQASSPGRRGDRRPDDLAARDRRVRGRRRRGVAATWVRGGADAVPVVPARLEILPRPSEALSVFAVDRNLAVRLMAGHWSIAQATRPGWCSARSIGAKAGCWKGRAARDIRSSRQTAVDAFFDGVALKRVAVTGGPVLTICQSQIPRGASWGDDGHIVFATQDETKGLFRVPADGGDPVELSKPDRAAGERGHWHLSVLPGGRGVLFHCCP